MVSVHHRYAVAGGRTVFYREAGDRDSPAVVLLHGAPAVEEFDYTFDSLTGSVAALLDELGLDRYAIYVQDYGAPVGWRLEGLTLERIRWQYMHGVPDPTRVDPDAWIHDHAQVNRPGAEVHLLDGGHFLLESELDSVASLMTEFLGRTIKDGR